LSSVAPAPRAALLQRLLRVAPPQVFLVLLMTAVVSVVIFGVSEMTAGRIQQTRLEVSAVRNALTQISLVRAGIAQAESSQRGYLLTGDERYLRPLDAAVATAQNGISELAAATGEQLEWRARTDSLRGLVAKKLDEVRLTVNMAAHGESERALAQVRAGSGLQAMEAIQQRLNEFEPLLEAEIRRREHVLDDTWLQQRIGVGVVVLINLGFLAVLANMMMRQFTAREAHRSELQQQTDRLERMVADRTAELESLSSYLQTSTEREKARLARDLHDELGGILTAAKIDASWLEGFASAAEPDVQQRMRRLSASLDEAVELKRRVIENLRPSLLDHLGLAAAVEWYAQETCDNAGLGVTVNVPAAMDPIPPEVAIAVYRIVQESLTNAVKYAQARNIQVQLRQPPGRLELSVADDGIGIANYHAAHFTHGIAGMRQRARSLGGDFSLHTSPGAGTEIRAVFPLKEETLDDEVPLAA
jgi:signal transduction histidine kinase